MAKRRATLLVGLLLAAVWAGWWLDRYRWSGGFRTVTPHFAGRCRPVEGVPGPEDLLIDAASGIAYISSYDRAAAAAGKAVPGAIYAYDLNRADAAPKNLTPRATPDFRPHGISLYRDASGRAWLHVITHPPAGDAVDLLEIQGGRLAYVRTIRGPALTSANDLAAVDRDRFYVTNSRGYASGVRAWLEANLRLAWANVVYYDGSAFTPALNGIAFPNGIDIDRRTGDVYAVSSFDQAIHVYARNATSGALTFKRSVKVGTRLDNVNVAEDGALWVAGRAQYFDSPQPSQVVRVTNAASDTPRVDEVYVNDGRELGNASAAAVHGRRLLVGASRGNRFLDCVME